MEEAERLCDRVAILDHGKVIALGTPRELVASLGAEHVVEFSVDEGTSDALTAEVLAALPSVEGVAREGGRWRLTVREVHRAVPALLEEAEARQAMARGQVVLVVSADDPPIYAYDPTQPESRAARLAVDAALQSAAGRADAFTAGHAELTEPGTRYVDFLVPGLLGMNLMGTGIWGIGFSLVVARQGNLLKRLVASPVRRSHLLGAQLLSRLIFLVPEAGALLLFAS